MKRLRDVTFGEALGSLVPYRPFIALAAAIALLLVALPGPDGSGSSDIGGDAASSSTPFATDDTGEPTTTGGGSVGDAATANPPETAAPPTFGSGATGAPVAAAGTTGDTLGTTGPVAPSGTWPGVGTPAALGAPDCDRNTGFLRMHTKAWNLPCVPLWPAGADNGGATTMGVTAEEIRVVMYIPKGSPASDNAMRALGINDSPEQQEESSRGIVDIYARHGELYGRRVKLVKVVGSGDTAEAYRADAIDIVNKYKPFAVFPSNGGACPAMYALAQRKVITTCGVLASKANIDSGRGYHWDTSVFPNDVEQAYAAAEVVGKQLSGRKARWAGDPTFRLQPRKFGWIYLDTPESAAANRIFESELARYGVKLTTKVGVAADLAQASEQTRTAIARMKNDGVNVVIPHALAEFTAMRHATSANYLPEWFDTGQLFAATFFIRTVADPQQARALYALKTVPPLPPSEKLDRNQLYQWEHGRQPTAKLLALQVQPAVYTIFAGIHLAGPHLTFETFREGMFRRLPVMGGARNGAVTSAQFAFGFRGVWPYERQGVASMSAVDDELIAWWSPTAPCEDEAGKQGVGCLMAPNGGKRLAIGSLTNEEPPMFVENGAVGQLSDLPPAERAPDYPNKKGCPSRQACYGSS